MSNPNLAVWVTDWHVTGNDSETGQQGTGDETLPTEAYAMVEHIRNLDPALVFDTGDCKDNYGTGGAVTIQHDNYISIVRDSGRLPWPTLNADSGITATKPILPGNHDEDHDYTESGTSNVRTSWDSRFWGTPYHFTFNWTAPKIKFIALHTEILHEPDANAGLFTIDSGEVTWMNARIAEMPAGWSAIILTHCPLISDFGNNLDLGHGGTGLLAAIDANNTKIKACLCGHRHFDNTLFTYNGIPHITGTCVSYTNVDTSGGFNILQYDPTANKLRFHMRRGPSSSTGISSFGRPPAYTVMEIALPASSNTPVTFSPVQASRYSNLTP